MSGGHQLSKAENLLDNFNAAADFSLNDLLEFYNIKLYFDNNLFLTTWTEDKKKSYKANVELAYNQLKERIYKVTDGSLEQGLTDIEYNFYDDYWSLLNNINDLKKITDTTLTEVLGKHPRQISYILKEKKLVDKYDKTIRKFLIGYSDSAQILLSSLEEKDTFGRREKNHFPKSLTLNDKEAIINSYLDTEDPNLNYVVNG